MATTTTTQKTSVVILGGSTVGLCSALFLAARRVPFVLVEKHAGSSKHPRAIGWTHRTMEIFRGVGVAERFPTQAMKGGKPRRVTTKTLNGEWSGEMMWTPGGEKGKGAPQEGQAGKEGPQQGRQPQDGKGGPTQGGRGGPPGLSNITPVDSAGIAQDALEPLLRTRIDELLRAGIDSPEEADKKVRESLRLGYQMTSWSQDQNGVQLSATAAKHNETEHEGTEINIEGAYLVACDGGRSTVREDLGIEMSYGVGYMRTLRSILFKCPSIEEYRFKSGGVHQWNIRNEEEKLEAFMVTYSDGRWALMSYDEPDWAEGDEAAQKQFICKAIGEVKDDVEVLAQGAWELRACVADKFVAGRVLLAGDAAHTLPPSRGGYGANTGIADAHNIAWKLAAVLSGASSPSLLETYDAERRPVAVVRHDQIFARDDYKAYAGGSDWEKKGTGVGAKIIDDVAMELGQIYRSSAIDGADLESLPDAKSPAEWAGQPGTRAPHVALTRGEQGETISSLDLFGEGWVVLSKDVGVWKDKSPSASSGLKFVEVGKDVAEKGTGNFSKAYGLEADDGAVLVRPDGVVAARWSKAPGNAMEELTRAFAQVAHLRVNRFDS
ncbi:2,4-dichlorophenol 6-monooxygenase [Xylariaceae sp. FL0255]|nr:2,4-dichlorophenol 6-monooxygenase [Xylariaceae sp. FL0255]